MSFIKNSIFGINRDPCLEINITYILRLSTYSQRRRVLAHRELDLLPDGGGELVLGGDAAYHRPSLLII